MSIKVRIQIDTYKYFRWSGGCFICVINEITRINNHLFTFKERKVMMMMMMKLQTDTYGNRNAQSLLPWQQFRLQRPSAAARCCENSRRSFQSYKTLFGATNSIELVLPSCRCTRRWKKNNIKKRKNGKIHFRHLYTRKTDGVCV